MKDIPNELSESFISNLEANFEDILSRKDEIIGKILEFIPSSWNVNLDMVESKMNQLFNQKWVKDCWKTFIEYFNEAIR